MLQDIGHVVADQSGMIWTLMAQVRQLQDLCGQSTPPVATGTEDGSTSEVSRLQAELREARCRIAVLEAAIAAGAESQLATSEWVANECFVGEAAERAARFSQIISTARAKAGPEASATSAATRAAASDAARGVASRTSSTTKNYRPGIDPLPPISERDMGYYSDTYEGPKDRPRPRFPTLSNFDSFARLGRAWYDDTLLWPSLRSIHLATGGRCLSHCSAPDRKTARRFMAMCFAIDNAEVPGSEDILKRCDPGMPRFREMDRITGENAGDDSVYIAGHKRLPDRRKRTMKSYYVFFFEGGGPLGIKRTNEDEEETRKSPRIDSVASNAPPSPSPEPDTQTESGLLFF